MSDDSSEYQQYNYVLLEDGVSLSDSPVPPYINNVSSPKRLSNTGVQSERSKLEPEITAACRFDDRLTLKPFLERKPCHVNKPDVPLAYNKLVDGKTADENAKIVPLSTSDSKNIELIGAASYLETQMESVVLHSEPSKQRVSTELSQNVCIDSLSKRTLSLTLEQDAAKVAVTDDAVVDADDTAIVKERAPVAIADTLHDAVDCLETERKTDNRTHVGVSLKSSEDGIPEIEETVMEKLKPVDLLSLETGKPSTERKSLEPIPSIVEIRLDDHSVKSEPSNSMGNKGTDEKMGDSKVVSDVQSKEQSGIAGDSLKPATFNDTMRKTSCTASIDSNTLSDMCALPNTCRATCLSENVALESTAGEKGNLVVTTTQSNTATASHRPLPQTAESCGNELENVFSQSDGATIVGSPSGDKTCWNSPDRPTVSSVVALNLTEAVTTGCEDIGSKKEGNETAKETETESVSVSLGTVLFKERNLTSGNETFPNEEKMNKNKSDLPMKENSKEIVRPSREKPCRSEQTDCSEPPPEVASPVDSASASVATTAASVMAQRPSLNEGSITTAGKWTSPRIKERKTYTDHDIDDDEIEGKRNYTIDDKLLSEKYNKDYVQYLKGEDFTLKYLQEKGLQKPILFLEKSGLGLRVPSENFQVSDVKQCVGSRRLLDVMDVTTQKGIEMPMKEWVKYYQSADRDRLLNVISLEFSQTKLENYVESPSLVRQVDWVDCAWPQHLKECQTEATNIIDKMKYPKVQKYCLMSVAGCYTDFHIDFGGTSVWYHVLHGEKVFWLIPPTERNLDLYEDWVLSGKQGDIFLADQTCECQRILLKPGNTFIIPSGWIHAVYTPKDSLVFGGNFVHSFNIINQLRVTAVEERTHVPGKFKYPFFTEISWYVLERYIHSLTGKTYLEKPQLGDLDNQFLSEKELTSPGSPFNDDVKLDVKTEVSDSFSTASTHKLAKRVAISLTRIDQSPRRKSTSDDDSTASAQPRSPVVASASQRSVRKSSSESSSSLPDITGLKVHSSDTERDVKPFLEGYATGGYKDGHKMNLKQVQLSQYELKGLAKLVEWLENLPSNKKSVPRDLLDADAVIRSMKKILEEHANDDPVLAATGEPVLVWPAATKKLLKMKQKARLMASSGVIKVKGQGKGQGGASSIRHRRTRCKKCEPCTRSDCGECNFCKDMKKYGGPGRMKQSCISRQCLAPILPNTALCMLCKEDHHERDEDTGESYSTLMECGICWEIVHPNCLKQKYENLDMEGVINEDLPNSWKCPKCCGDGREGQLKSRVFKGLPKCVKPSGQGLDLLVSTGDESLGYPPSALSDETPTEGKRVTLKQEKDRGLVKIITVGSPISSPRSNGSHTDSHTDKPKHDPGVKSNGLRTKQNGSPLKHSPVSSNLESPAKDRGRLGRPPKNSPSPKPGASRSKSPSTTPESPTGRQPVRPRVSPRRPLQSTAKRRPSTGPVQTATAIKKRRLSSLSSSPRAKRDMPVKTRNQSTKPSKPVITRSGRTVKKSPTLRDENLATPDLSRKRPRREDSLSLDSQSITTAQGAVRSSSSKFPPKSLRARHTERIHTKGSKVGKRSKSKLQSNSLSYDNDGLEGHGDDGDKCRAEGEPSLSGVTLSPAGDDISSQPTTSEVKRPIENLTQIYLEHIQKKELRVVLQKYVARPSPGPVVKNFVKTELGEIHKLPRLLWVKVFSFLSHADLARCLSVCRSWDSWGINPDLWKHIDLNRKRIIQTHLMGIVRRQPECLNLSSVTMTQRQLAWLVERLPLLKSLNVSKCSWVTISGLCTSSCPLLHSLDVSWAAGLKDQCFEDLITPPVDGKPGVKNISRLHRLKQLNLAGTEVTDDSLELITVHLPRLEKLNLSYCTRVSDNGIKKLTSPRAAVQDTLLDLNLSGCRKLGEATIVSLRSCKNLRRLDISACSNIPSASCEKFRLHSLKEYKS